MKTPADSLIFDFDAPPEVAAEERLRLLGGKGANLVVMASELGLPVPPGFTITTAACRTFLAGEWPAGLDDELRARMARLGQLVGRDFGDPADPLLVSVRSGAPVSMPGMMDTVLNLGLNKQNADGLAHASSGGADFAADCLHRLRAGYRDVIGAGEVPDDPWRQLRRAIEAVFRSWNSDRARAYRRREGIADDLGTAVTVQAMVFGNRGADSGTGVMFTRNPSTGENTPYGDILFDAQGEDVVAGGHATRSLDALDERLPAVGRQLRDYATRLEHHYADLCDIEFTVENGRLWLLQVRVGKRSPRAALRMAIDMALDESFPLSRADAVGRVASLLSDPPRVFVRAGSPAAIASGLPASPGLAGGAIVTSSAAAEESAARGVAVILVREDTSPEDVPGMARSNGVLTARGGLACHAAVVARGWGIPAVVGAGSVRLTADGASIGSESFKSGERITIDGSTGEIFAGDVPGSSQVAPEAATLLEWAAELGIDVTGPEADEAQPTPPDPEAAAGSSAGVEANGVLRTLAIKGTVTAEQLADSLLATPADVQPLLDELAADGQLEMAAGQWRPTAAGKETAAQLFTTDRTTLGEAAAGQALEAFHPFDARMKDIVTAWQVREVDGEQQLNDHADAAYDEQVLDSLAALDEEVGAWLSSLSALARFNTYRLRLSRAANQARTDQRYVASPRVDSYHGAWFELHEDLIRVAGRTREAEASAGRA